MALLSAITKAVDELVQLGYPREVAERIADGTLDMRTEARVERQQELYPDVFYTGTTSPDILDTPSSLNEIGTGIEPQFLYMSESPALAASYAGKKQGRFADEAPTIYPFAVDTTGFDRLLGDKKSWNALENPRIELGGDPQNVYTAPGIGYSTDDIAQLSYELASPGLIMRDVIDPGPYAKLMRMGLQGKRGDASQFEFDNFLRELEQAPPTNVVVPDTNRVRSLFAAFDPEYKGSNILGGAATAAVGAGLLAAPGEAEAGVLGKGASEIRDAFDTKLYRGAQEGLEEFGLNQAGLLFATPNKRVAEDFALAPDRQVYSLLAAPGRSWSPTNPEDVNALLSKIDTDKLYSEYTDPKITGAASDYYKEVGKSETIEEFIEGLNIGAYQSLEMPSALQALRDAGYDSFRVGEEGQLNDLNYGFFDASRVKIAPTVTAGVLGSSVLAAPEEAEAGVIKTFGREFDPRFDPRVKEQEKLRDTAFTIEERGTQNAPRIPLADLEGRPFVTTMSDRTQAGGLLTGIDDVALDRPINLQGGQGFMFENPGMVWASAPGVVNQIMRAASEVGDNPVYLPFRMAPTGGDFATMTGETMLSFASSNMNKTQKKALDKAIRDYESVGSMVQGKRVGAGLKIKGWKGVDDPSSVEVWRNTPDTLRKELMNMMDVQFRDKGGLSIGQARLAVTEPGQADALDAQIQNIGEIFTGKDVVQASGHPSYPAGVPGQGLGRTDQEVNIFELLTDARFGGQQKPVGDPLKPTAQEIRALQMKPYTGRITEDTLKALEARGVEVGSVNPSLLAALAAGSGAGTLAMQDESVADTAARLRAESDTSGAYAPRSGLLQDVTMAARDLERRLEGSPASLLFPSGYIQHLEEFNRPYERSTYTGALLGALDFL